MRAVRPWRPSEDGKVIEVLPGSDLLETEKARLRTGNTFNETVEAEDVWRYNLNVTRCLIDSDRAILGEAVTVAFL